MKEGNKIEGEEKGRETGEKISAAAYRDNMDVVMREDLKDVFEKFGKVKVIGFSPYSWCNFMPSESLFEVSQLSIIIIIIIIINSHLYCSLLEFVFLLLEGYFCLFVLFDHLMVGYLDPCY